MAQLAGMNRAGQTPAAVLDRLEEQLLANAQPDSD
jgi:hypothetical protein